MIPRSDSNWQPSVYKTTAPPVELRRECVCLSTPVIPALYSVNLTAPNGKRYHKPVCTPPENRTQMSYSFGDCLATLAWGVYGGQGELRYLNPHLNRVTLCLWATYPWLAVSKEFHLLFKSITDTPVERYGLWTHDSGLQNQCFSQLN